MEPVQYPYHIQVIYDLQADNTSAKFRVEIEGYDPRGGIMLLGRDFGLHSYYVRRSGIAGADETTYTWRRTVDCALQPLAGVGVAVWEIQLSE